MFAGRVAAGQVQCIAQPSRRNAVTKQRAQRCEENMIADAQA